ncbi:MAG: type IX secretion system membrane protein PorP/SprF [Chryseolinea sp.]
MPRRIFFTMLLLTVGLHSFAQQDPLFTQYMFNNMYMTPAAVGVDGVTRFTAVHRSQWLGYQSSFGDGGAPTTQLVSFNTPLYKLHSGFGAYVMNDKLGPQNNLEAQAMYAYHLGIKESKLSIGIKVGLYSQSIDWDKYRAVNPDDPILKPGKDSQVRPDLGAGLFYRAEKYYAGVGFNHLIRQTFNFGLDSARGALENHINVTAGYFYEVSFDLKLQFTGAMRTDLNKTQVDFAGIAHIKDTMYGGLAFRQSEAASLLLGYSLLKDKSLRLGTAIDFIVKDRAAKENFSLEFMLSYDLPTNPGTGKKVVRTPRYRH